MVTISEVARHAGVSVEGVLRVLNDERVSEDVDERVRKAIGIHGYPHRGAPRESESVKPTDVGDPNRKLESHSPGGVGSLMYEAVRVEVRPVLEQVAATGDLTDEIVRLLRERRASEHVERRERLEDLALLIDLMTTSWQNVDRRLGRIERRLEELGTQPREELVPRVLRSEDRRRRALEPGSRASPAGDR